LSASLEAFLELRSAGVARGVPSFCVPFHPLIRGWYHGDRWLVLHDARIPRCILQLGCINFAWDTAEGFGWWRPRDKP
jgi:hypothetical protein